MSRPSPARHRPHGAGPAALLLGAGLLAGCGDGGPHFESIGPSPGDHVVSLARDARGTLHAGTGTGEVLRHRSGADWDPLSGDTGAGGVTTLVTEPRRVAGGVDGARVHLAGDWRAFTDAPFDGAAIAALLADDDGGLWVATSDAVHHASNALEDWTTLPATGLDDGPPVYRLGRDADGALLTATIGGGVRRLSGDRWQRDSAGLPDGVKVFDFQRYGDTALAIGTDHGPYGRPAPDAAWRPLGEGLAGKRVIALTTTGTGDDQRLWAGGDAGIHVLTTIDGPWEAVPMHPEPTSAVAWLLSVRGTVHAAAGRVYRLSDGN